MPRLLNAAEIVEVVAEPLLVKVPSFTTCAVLPLSAAPRLLVMMFNPLFVVWSLNVAPSAIVSVPEPTSLTPVFGFESFRLIWTNVPVAVLAPPNCSTRPPSNPKLVEVNAAPPCASVVPDPPCVPPENAEAPVTVSVPAPLSKPPDCVSAPVVAFEPPTFSVPLVMFSALPRFATVPASVAVPPLTVVDPETL